MHDLEAEWTPRPNGGQRLDPNPLNWFRFENVMGGFSSRLFYNEVPQFSWKTQKGHMTADDSEAERDRVLYSFTHAN